MAMILTTQVLPPKVCEWGWEIWVVTEEARDQEKGFRVERSRLVVHQAEVVVRRRRRPGGSGAGGITYGEANLDVLMGGSGGGLGNAGEAGAGGGAIELIASGKILIEQGAQISVPGGSVFVNPEIGANYSGGAGSGGSIRLVGSTVQNLGILDVRGGSSSGGDVREPGARFMRKSGGAGGGGRISLIADGEIQSGTTLVSGGSENGDGSAGLRGLFSGGPEQAHLSLNWFSIRELWFLIPADLGTTPLEKQVKEPLKTLVSW